VATAAGVLSQRARIAPEAETADPR
jgi:hypothetical protein